jgi:hypothetical protein
MAGINFSISGKLTIGLASTAKCLCLIVPNNSRRVLIKECSVTASDPNGNGGYVNIAIALFSSIGTMSSGTPRKDDPNISETVGIDTYIGLASVEPTLDYKIQSKDINARGGEFLWVAIREEDKLPISGGNSSGTGKMRVGLIAETDSIANGTVINYNMRCEF